MKNIIKQYKLILFSILIGLLAGWMLFHSGGNRQENDLHAGHDHESAEGTIWTCSMHPQIQQDEPGPCPICAMDLISLEVTASDQEGVDPNEVSMTESAAKLASIQTYYVKYGAPKKSLHLQGKVAEDERNIAKVTARFGGRIEKLEVNFTGQQVVKGQVLATIYSPGLLSAQKELLESAKMRESRPALYNAARSKLLLWSLTEDQISGIENKGEPRSQFEILSPISGTVTMRHVALGDYVKEGSALFMVVDLSSVWIQLDAYESDLPWIKLNDPVSFKLRSVPGRKYTARVAFIDPVINSRTRVAKVRLNFSNSKGLLKPEMFVSAVLEASLPGAYNQLVIPKTAVLWTGKRSLVYVAVPDRETPSFLMREIVLGVEAGNQYLIEEGLTEGEEIVVNGVFKIDAAAQLRGLPSMMNPGGGMRMTGHSHGDMAEEKSTMAEHSHDDSAEADSVQQEEIIAFEVDPQFKLQLTELYDVYLPMKDAFVLTNSKKVMKAGKKLIPYLDAVDMQLLEGDAHMVWMGQLNTMKTAIDKIINTKDIEMQRLAFSDFNSGIYRAVKSFGVDSQQVYYQFCPMAFNDKGAYWLSSEEQISNPYFGDVMLRCGEVKEVIEQ